MAEFTEAQIRQLAREEFNGGSKCQLGIRNEERIKSLDKEVTEVKDEIVNEIKTVHGRIDIVSNDIKSNNRDLIKWLMGVGSAIIVAVITAGILK